MAHHSAPADLFAAAPALPEGFAYRPEFITSTEEARLIAIIRTLALEPAQYRAYEARRRILSFGASYDFSANRLRRAPPVPDFLLPLRGRVAAWAYVPPGDFEHALLTEYAPGTPIGWHRDAPDFEIVVGLSLAGRCRMRFRPYPHVAHRRGAVLDVELAPRSAYVLREAARWRWQHQIPPTSEHRYSITFRTLANRTKRALPTL